MFSTSPVRFGRSAQNDLPLPETYVSEWHGAIRFEADVIEVTDLGSTNGTTLDGQKLVPGAPVRAEGSTVFQIGPLMMLVEPVFDETEDPGVAHTMLHTPPVKAVAPQAWAGGAAAPSPAGPPAASVQPAFNPPTLFGDRPFPAPQVEPMPSGAPNHAVEPRGRVATTQPPPSAQQEGAVPTFNPPTLFGMSADSMKPQQPPAPVPAAAPQPFANGPISFNPPTLFGVSPKDVLAQGPPRAASPPPAAPGMTPKAAPEAAAKSLNPPTLFGDRPVMPPPEPAPPAMQPALLRSGAVAKSGNPPTLFGVATGAVARAPGAPAKPSNGDRGLAPGVVPPSPAAPASDGAQRAAGPAWPAPIEAEAAKPSASWPAPAPAADDRFRFTSPPQAQAPAQAHAPEPAPPPRPAAFVPVAAPAAIANAGTPVGSTRAMSADDRPDLKTQAVLRAFCDAFVDLRRGFEEAGAELGVRTVSGSSPLHLARDGAELLRYMTEASADPVARGQELRAFIADFAVHQVAMMEGVNRGMRAMLSALDPQEFGIEKGPSFMRILDKDRWRLYTEQFSELLETDHELNQRVFGSEFAEGYASVIYGAKGGGRGRDEEDKPRRSPSKPTRRRRP